MIAILLCAGYATRMYPLTRDVPKPLLPVADKPVLDYVVEQLAALPDLTALHVVTNARFFLRFEHWAAAWQPRLAAVGRTLTLHNDGSTDNANRLGAVADMALVLRTLDRPSAALVAAGDNIFRFSLAALQRQFLARAAHCVVALHEPDVARLRTTGVLELDADDRVLRMHEKPAQPPTHWACPPLYFFTADARAQLDAFAAGHPGADAPGMFIAALCRQAPVYALRTRGTRVDIGSIAGYAAADRLLRDIAAR